MTRASTWLRRALVAVLVSTAAAKLLAVFRGELEPEVFGYFGFSVVELGLAMLLMRRRWRPGAHITIGIFLLAAVVVLVQISSSGHARTCQCLGVLGPISLPLALLLQGVVLACASAALLTAGTSADRSRDRTEPEH